MSKIVVDGKVLPEAIPEEETWDVSQTTCGVSIAREPKGIQKVNGVYVIGDTKPASTLPDELFGRKVIEVEMEPRLAGQIVPPVQVLPLTEYISYGAVTESTEVAEEIAKDENDDDNDNPSKSSKYALI